MWETLRHMMITESDKGTAQLALQGASSTTVGLIRRIRLRTHRASPSLTLSLTQLAPHLVFIVPLLASTRSLESSFSALTAQSISYHPTSNQSWVWSTVSVHEAQAYAHLPPSLLTSPCGTMKGRGRTSTPSGLHFSRPPPKRYHRTKTSGQPGGCRRSQPCRSGTETPEQSSQPQLYFFRTVTLGLLLGCDKMCQEMREGMQERWQMHQCGFASWPGLLIHVSQERTILQEHTRLGGPPAPCTTARLNSQWRPVPKPIC